MALPRSMMPVGFGRAGSVRARSLAMVPATRRFLFLLVKLPEPLLAPPRLLLLPPKPRRFLPLLPPLARLLLLPCLRIASSAS